MSTYVEAAFITRVIQSISIISAYYFGLILQHCRFLSSN